MAVLPFYENKLIDDAAIACGKIIMAGCDSGNTHFYVDPCEILEQCLGERPAINRCSMIPNIVNGQPGIPSAAAGRILRVNLAGSCVEFVPASDVFIDMDRRVRISSGDTTSGYLSEKLVSCDPAKVQLQILNPGGNEQLRICVNVPTSITDLIDVGNFPTCVNKPGKVLFLNNAMYFDCQPTIASYYMTADRSFTFLQNVIEFKPLHNQTGGPGGTSPQNFDIFKGDPIFLPASGQTGCFVIPRSGMYRVYAKASMIVNYNMQAMRLAIATTNAKGLLADSKFAADPQTSMVNLNQGAFQRHDTYTCENYVYLNQGDLVACIIRADTNVSNTLLDTYSHIPVIGREATVTIFHSTLGDGTYDSGSTFPHSWTGAQFSIQFLGDYAGENPYQYN